MGKSQVGARAGLEAGVGLLVQGMQGVTERVGLKQCLRGGNRGVFLYVDLPGS